MQSQSHQPCSAGQRASVYAECEKEANRFKWIESEKAGRDLGEQAIRRWVKEHWWGYLRARWLEHLEGKQFWEELTAATLAFCNNALSKTPFCSTAFSIVSNPARKTSTSSSGPWTGASISPTSKPFC